MQKKLDQREFESFADFWPHYVLAHRARPTYVLHAIGIVLALAWLVYCFINARLVLMPVALIIGYGFAIPAHFLFEGNKPASFYAPFYSFLADFKLTYTVLSGRMQNQIRDIENKFS